MTEWSNLVIKHMTTLAKKRQPLHSSLGHVLHVLDLFTAPPATFYHQTEMDKTLRSTTVTL